MKKILIFGGTTEGRELSEWCRENNIPADVSVTTDYGARLLGQDKCLNVFTGRLDRNDMVRLINAGGYGLAVDATHPYATEATRNIMSACELTGLPYYRLLRGSSELSGTAVGSIPDLVTLLNTTDKVILCTLGSKELPLLTGVNDRKRRMWLRLLPAVGIEEQCEKYGFDREHIIAEKPPYSVDDNIAHIRKSGAEILVTKESGAAGGYPEKSEAAEKCGIGLITLIRPSEEGYSFDELKRIISEE